MKVNRRGSVVVVGAIFLASVCLVAEVSAQAAREERKDPAAEVGSSKGNLDGSNEGETSDETGQNIKDELETKIVELKDEIERMGVEQEAEKARMADALSTVAETEAAMKATSKEMTSLTERVEAIEANPRAGYDQGFFIAASEQRFKLSLRGFVRSRYSLVLERQWRTDSEGNILAGQDRDSPARVVSENGFDIQSARLMMMVT